MDHCTQVQPATPSAANQQAPAKGPPLQCPTVANTPTPSWPTSTQQRYGQHPSTQSGRGVMPVSVGCTGVPRPAGIALSTLQQLHKHMAAAHLGTTEKPWSRRVTLCQRTAAGDSNSCACTLHKHFLRR